MALDTDKKLYTFLLIVDNKRIFSNLHLSYKWCYRITYTNNKFTKCWCCDLLEQYISKNKYYNYREWNIDIFKLIDNNKIIYNGKQKNIA